MLLKVLLKTNRLSLEACSVNFLVPTELTVVKWKNKCGRSCRFMTSICNCRFPTKWAIPVFAHPNIGPKPNAAAMLCMPSNLLGSPQSNLSTFIYFLHHGTSFGVSGVCQYASAVYVQQCAAECVNGRAWAFLSTDSMPCTIRRLLTKRGDAVCHYRMWKRARVQCHY